MKRLWRTGEPFIWITGGALCVALLMVAGLVGLILVNGLGFFWPGTVTRLTLLDGKTVTGQLVEREAIPGKPGQYRIKLKVGNRDLYGADFLWLDESQVSGRGVPPEVAVVERTEWGVLIGTITEVRESGRTVATGRIADTGPLRGLLAEAARVRREIRSIETGAIGAINHRQERIRLRLRTLEREGGLDGAAARALRDELADLDARYQTQATRLGELRARQTASVVVAADGGKQKELPLGQVVDVYFPNAMSLPAKAAHYVGKAWEFVSDDPRESNTEGGVFPAIFGTVMMVMIMSILVTPLGSARGPLPARVRQAGRVRERGPDRGQQPGRRAVHRLRGLRGGLLHLHRRGARSTGSSSPSPLPTPTFGTGGILWASLTLALLTVPVVIVATEEGLAAIPRGLREASLRPVGDEARDDAARRAAGGHARRS